MKKYIVLPNGEKLTLSPLSFREFCVHCGIEPHDSKSYFQFEEFKDSNRYFELEDVFDGMHEAILEVHDEDANIIWNGRDCEWQSFDGIPQDDEWSLQKLVRDDNFGLNHLHPLQFVQNETVKSMHKVSGIAWMDRVDFDPIEHVPVVAGTATGTVYLSEEAVQTFEIPTYGYPTFQVIGQPNKFLVNLYLDIDTGIITAICNDNIDPACAKLVVSYEYNLEWQLPKYRPYKPTKIKKNEVEID